LSAQPADAGPTGSPRLRRATTADAPAIAELGERVFRATFGPLNTPEDLALYLPTAYGETRQRAEILHPRWVTIVAEIEGVAESGAIAGFVQLREGAAPPSVRGRDPIEIQRFYVDPAWHGRGVAQALMQAAEEAARERQATAVWLGVWEKNPRGIAFYEKCGFRHVGEQPFLLGRDLQTDWVMEKDL
jgi:ribosomal protein S18 acetylase RimI-like enzyme